MSNEITIAQALRKVKKIKGLIATHRERAIAGVSYDAEHIPAFSFSSETEEMCLLIDEMVDLESRIAAGNALATIQEGPTTMSLAKAIRTLQEIKGMIHFYESLLLKSGTEKVRNSEWDDDQCKNIIRVEEKNYVSDLSEQYRYKRVKELQDRFESLNNLVEDMNHKYVV